MRETRTGRVIAAAAAAALALICCAAVPEAGAAQLVLSSSQLPGLRSAHASTGQARADLDAGLSRHDQVLVRDAQAVQVAARLLSLDVGAL